MLRCCQFVFSNLGHRCHFNTALCEGRNAGAKAFPKHAFNPLLALPSKTKIRLAYASKPCGTQQGRCLEVYKGAVLESLSYLQTDPGRAFHHLAQNGWPPTNFITVSKQC